MLSRRALALLVVTVVLAVPACSKKEAADTSTSGTADRDRTTTTDDRDEEEETTTTTETEPMSEAELSALLLEVAELPPGWSTSAMLGESTDDGDDDVSDDIVCPSGEEAVDLEGTEAEVAFQRADLGPFVLQGLIVPDEVDAEEGLARTIAALDACVGQTWDDTDDDGDVTTLTLSELSIPEVGDESAGYRLSGQLTDGSLTMDLVLVREGDVLAMFGGMSVTTIMGSNPLDPAEFAEIVEAGVDKLAAA